MWDATELMQRLVALAEEVDLYQDAKVREEDRAQAAQHVRAYLPDFRKAGVVLSFRDTKGRRVRFGKEKAAFLLLHSKERPSVRNAARLVAAPGRRKGVPLLGAFLVWPLDVDESEEDILRSSEEFYESIDKLLSDETLLGGEETAP